MVVNKVVEGKGNFGFNAATGEYGDLVEMGVVDPTKVARFALQNAASVASLMLTTEAMVAEIAEGRKADGWRRRHGRHGRNGRHGHVSFAGRTLESRAGFIRFGIQRKSPASAGLFFQDSNLRRRTDAETAQHASSSRLGTEYCARVNPAPRERLRRKKCSHRSVA